MQNPGHGATRVRHNLASKNQCSSDAVPANQKDRQKAARRNIRQQVNVTSLYPAAAAAATRLGSAPLREPNQARTSLFLIKNVH